MTEQEMVCEIMSGDIRKHIFIISKMKKPVAEFTNLNNIPYMSLHSDLAETASQYIQKTGKVGETMSFKTKTDFGSLVQISIPVSRYTEYVFRHMIGGDKTLDEIYKAIQQDLKDEITITEFIAEIGNVFTPIVESGLLLLRSRNTNIKSFYEITDIPSNKI